jgi:hypothetical protein
MAQNQLPPPVGPSSRPPPRRAPGSRPRPFDAAAVPTVNLGIRTFLNGAFVSNIVLDTTQAATDTIDFVATDHAGLLTSTSTRTVIVSAPQAANDNQASSTPPAANDNTTPLAATGTTATSTP